MNQTLITPSEVVKYSGLGVSFPICDFKMIAMNEKFEMRQCLGKQFYRDMLADLADYSDVEEWSPLTSYIVGNLVVFDGTVYEAIDTSEGIEPLNADFWTLADKFESDCYNEFFCEYLGFYLAYIMLRIRLPFIWTKIEGRGIIQFNDQSFSTVSSKDFDRLDAAVLRQIQIANDNMIDYLKENKDNECFANYQGFVCDECGCKPCGCTKEYQGHDYVFG